EEVGVVAAGPAQGEQGLGGAVVADEGFHGGAHVGEGDDGGRWFGGFGGEGGGAGGATVLDAGAHGREVSTVRIQAFGEAEDVVGGGVAAGGDERVEQGAVEVERGGGFEGEAGEPGLQAAGVAGADGREQFHDGGPAGGAGVGRRLFGEQAGGGGAHGGPVALAQEGLDAGDLVRGAVVAEFAGEGFEAEEVVGVSVVGEGGGEEAEVLRVAAVTEEVV